MSLFVFGIVVAIAAVVGAQFRPDAWYRRLRKPSWNPPDWVFGPAWSVLYVAIAVAGWLAWDAGGKVWTALMTLWAAQLLLNGVWSWLWFGRHQQVAALLDSCALLLVVVAFIAAAYPVSTVASLLFVPYALWVAFATALNATIWRMNRAPAPVAHANPQ
jgi:tryptophan-rich sensory protein